MHVSSCCNVVAVPVPARMPVIPPIPLCCLSLPLLAAAPSTLLHCTCLLPSALLCPLPASICPCLVLRPLSRCYPLLICLYLSSAICCCPSLCPLDMPVLCFLLCMYPSPLYLLCYRSCSALLSAVPCFHCSSLSSAACSLSLLYSALLESNTSHTSLSFLLRPLELRWFNYRIHRLRYQTPTL